MSEIEELSTSVARVEKVYVETFDKPDKFEEAVKKIGSVQAIIKSDDAPNGFFVESALGKDLRRELGELVHEKGWGLKELRLLQPSLEDIFLKLVTRDTKERERAEALEDGKLDKETDEEEAENSDESKEDKE